MDLHTARLLLRPFRADDHAPVHAFAGDPRRHEGRLRDHYLIRGEWRDRLLFAKVAGTGPAQLR
jgi:RimJ/RimL family protein N-acetyltransferase